MMDSAHFADALYGDGAGSVVDAPSTEQPTAPEPRPIEQSELARRRAQTEMELGLDPVEQPTDSAEQPNWDDAEVTVPDHIKAERNADQARRLFNGNEQFAHVLGDDILDGVPGMSDDLKVEVVSELREMAADAGMSGQDLEQFRTALGASVKEPISIETRIDWHEQTIQGLNDTYGNGAKSALRDAIKFVNQDPRRAAILDKSGSGDNPQMVLLMARLAKQARAAGKLK